MRRFVFGWKDWEGLGVGVDPERRDVASTMPGVTELRMSEEERERGIILTKCLGGVFFSLLFCSLQGRVLVPD